MALQQPQLGRRCTTPPGDLGEGRGHCKNRDTSLPLSPKPLQRLASDYVYSAGHEACGPIPGGFRLHLRRQCLLAPCAAQSRSLGHQRRPMQVRSPRGVARGTAGISRMASRPIAAPGRETGRSKPRAPGARTNQRAPLHARSRTQGGTALCAAAGVRPACSPEYTMHPGINRTEGPGLVFSRDRAELARSRVF
uniref:Uncharacterized protein n=1 Tax=Castor canadensis TaxID=51338 RepID=A0A8C0XQJ7_CASCN